MMTTKFDEYKKKVLEKIDAVLEEAWEQGYNEAKEEAAEELEAVQKELDEWKGKIKKWKEQLNGL